MGKHGRRRISRDFGSAMHATDKALSNQILLNTNAARNVRAETEAEIKRRYEDAQMERARQYQKGGD